MILPRFAVVLVAGFYLIGCSQAPSAKKETQPSKRPDAVALPNELPHATELEVEYALVVDNGKTTVHSDGKHHFRSGDRFRVEVRAAVPTFVYLFNKGNGDDEYLPMFPNRFQKTNPIVAAITLPGGEEWYTLDSRPGVENVVLIASAQALKEFDSEGQPISQWQFEERLTLLERNRRPASSRRFENAGLVQLFATNTDETAVVDRLPLDHR